ncbi:hypothetical protein TNCT_335731 [Trichonephila clavata]|uniref:Uncharacterized protein n=1 Tax=Trichonephila clavata TaxID=2740835 RepID=A0A8X6LU64_TRICU|nr:hypothetical protein TNCT_335731 [Trichonephila clavata]
MIDQILLALSSRLRFSLVIPANHGLDSRPFSSTNRTLLTSPKHGGRLGKITLQLKKNSLVSMIIVFICIFNSQDAVTRGLLQGYIRRFSKVGEYDVCETGISGLGSFSSTPSLELHAQTIFNEGGRKFHNRENEIGDGLGEEQEFYYPPHALLPVCTLMNILVSLSPC